jgi:septal ring factor EnvC (AmiA/AmiB activator)
MHRGTPQPSFIPVPPEEIPQPKPAEIAPPTAFGSANALVAQYKAVKNDLDQARQSAADFQRQLAAKTNECAGARRAFEVEVARLRAEVADYREERLQLANEVARIAGLEFRMKRITEERDGLRSQVETLRAQLAAQTWKAPEPLAPPVPFPLAASQEPMSGNERVYAKRLLMQLAASLEELRDVVDPNSERKETETPGPKTGEVISISFVG